MIEAEYANLDAGPALVDRSNRATIEVTGRDRVTWLHNLTTNHVKTLGAGEGNYAFALNVQGRILFDLNMLIRNDAIWLDLEGRFKETALKHLNKYIIVEDVRLQDRSADFVRIALVGSRSAEILSSIGAAHAGALPLLGSVEINFEGTAVLAVRTDFCGPRAWELFTPLSAGTAIRHYLLGLTESPAVTLVGAEAVEIRRIEAGIPWPGAEICDEYLPAETRQLERAVSFNKGCYLGQEVVERMRSRKVVARQLVGLRMAGPDIPPPGSTVTRSDGAVVGRVTSSCHSITLGTVIALGYVRSASSTPNETLGIEWEAYKSEAVVTELPFLK